MGADLLSFSGRFRDPQERYEEIKNVLASELEDYAGLEPDTGDEWDSVFEIKDGYLELDIYECFGNAGYAVEYIHKEFVKKYPDVQVEFFYKMYYPDFVEGQKVTYDGSVLICTEHSVYFEEVYDDGDDESDEYYDPIEAQLDKFNEEIKFKMIV